MGKAYLLGGDIPQDQEKAVHWLKLSAKGAPRRHQQGPRGVAQVDHRPVAQHPRRRGLSVQPDKQRPKFLRHMAWVKLRVDHLAPPGVVRDAQGRIVQHQPFHIVLPRRRGQRGHQPALAAPGQDDVVRVHEIQPFHVVQHIE